MSGTRELKFEHRSHLSLDEWVEEKEYQVLEEHWREHFHAFGIDEDDTESLVRLCMISLRDLTG